MVAVGLDEAGAGADELLVIGSDADVKRTLRPS